MNRAKKRLTLVMDSRDAWFSQPMITLDIMESRQAGSALSDNNWILTNIGNSVQQLGHRKI